VLLQAFRAHCSNGCLCGRCIALTAADSARRLSGTSSKIRQETPSTARWRMTISRRLCFCCPRLKKKQPAEPAVSSNWLCSLAAATMADFCSISSADNPGNRHDSSGLARTASRMFAQNGAARRCPDHAAPSSSWGVAYMLPFPGSIGSVQWCVR